MMAALAILFSTWCHKDALGYFSPWTHFPHFHWLFGILHLMTHGHSAKPRCLKNIFWQFVWITLRKLSSSFFCGSLVLSMVILVVCFWIHARTTRQKNNLYSCIACSNSICSHGKYCQSWEMRTHAWALCWQGLLVLKSNPKVCMYIYIYIFNMIYTLL